MSVVRAETPALAPRPSPLAGVLRVRANVIGALIMREIHTRYGRANVGYLWVFLEPMILATAVAAFHARSHAEGGVNMVTVTILGYCGFMLFRSIVLRAETVLEANRPLLFHRQVTLLDMLAARTLLEFGSIFLAFVVLLAGAIVLGQAPLPAHPLILVGAFGLMTWFAFALSMVVCTLAHQSQVVSRLLHPAIYLALPLSGAFILTSWIPAGLRPFLTWFPVLQIEELIRYGELPDYTDRWFHVPYVAFVCLALTFAGLLSLRAIRRHVDLT